MTISFADRLTHLPAGFSARTPERADIKACTKIVRDVDIACCGETTTTEIELEADLFSHTTHGPAGTAVIVHNGEVVAFINIFDELQDNRGVFYDIFVSPSIAADISSEISIELIKHMEVYTKQLMTECKINQAPIKTGVYENDLGLVAGIEKSNYTYHRTYWRMKIVFDHELQVPVFPQNYEVTEYKHYEAALKEVHEVQKTAFADYYDFNPVSFENWNKWYQEPMNDSSTWRLVRHNGELVGYIMGNKRFEDEHFGYVASIGVLREHRGKGIARALLQDMFIRDHARGMHGTILHGDSSNPTGAMKLYAAVGMKTDRVYLGYRKEIEI